MLQNATLSEITKALLYTWPMSAKHVRTGRMLTANEFDQENYYESDDNNIEFDSIVLYIFI